MDNTVTHRDIIKYTINIVSSFISKSNIEKEKIHELLKDVFHSVSNLAINPKEKSEPAVPIDQSYTDNYIICLEDGLKFKMLKRHLKNTYNMTINEYKKRWGLPRDYPTVCAEYAQRRSSIAKKAGLGNVGRGPRKTLTSNFEHAGVN